MVFTYFTLKLIIISFKIKRGKERRWKSMEVDESNNYFTNQWNKRNHLLFLTY